MQPAEPADAQPDQPQQQEERPAQPSLPVATNDAPKPPQAPAVPSGLGYFVTLGVAMGSVQTKLPAGKEGTFCAGAFFHANASGFTGGGFSYSGRLTALLGGGTAGLESMFAGRVYVGGGGLIGEQSQIFFRVGAEAQSIKNDEIEASLASIPAAQLGYQIWGHDVGFEIAPRIGLSPRTEYEPGDESLGRRHWRRLGVRPAAGGSAFFSAGKMVAIEASFTRVIDDEPIDLVDGRLCLTYVVVAVCGLGQYWKSIATLPTGPAAQEIPTMFIGGSIGGGVTGAGRDKVF